MTALTHDKVERAIRASYVISFIQGIVAIALVPRVPELVAQLNLNFAEWGTLIGLVSLSSLLPLVLSNRLILRYGSRRVMAVGGVIFAGSIAFIPWCTSAWEFALVAMTQTISGAAFNNALQSSVVILQKKLKKTVIGYVHAGWSIGATISAAISGALVAAAVPFKWHFGIAALVAAAAMFTATRFVLDKSNDGRLSEQKHVEKISWLKTPWYVWLLMAGFISGAWCESMMTDWSALFSKNVLQINNGLAAIAYAGFSGAMIVGRLSIGRLSRKMHISQLAMIGSVIGLVGIACGVLLGPVLLKQDQTLGMVVIVICWALAGLGSAAMVPSFFSAAGHVRGMNTVQVLSRLSFFSTFAFMGLKAMIGGIANINLQFAMLTPVIAFVIAGLISSRVAKTAKRREKEMIEAFPPTGILPIVAQD